MYVFEWLMLWACNLRVPGSCPPLLYSLDSSRDGVVEWFRALELKSGGPRFKSSTLPLNWICFLVVLSLTPPLHLVDGQRD